jgi:hypothetical protein
VDQIGDAFYPDLPENLPPWARKEIDAIYRRFFWAGSDASVQGKCMVAWPTVCRTTELGRLGISNLKLAGFALQARWLWFQKTDQDRAWSQLPIRTPPKVLAFFKASTYTVIGDKRNTLFWEDKWIHGEAISDIAPCLCQFVSSRTRRRQTMQQGLLNRSWVRAISGEVSTQAIHEYLALWDMV